MAELGVQEGEGSEEANRHHHAVWAQMAENILFDGEGRPAASRRACFQAPLPCDARPFLTALVAMNVA